jgi:chitin binding peritrophin-A-like protein with CBM14 domain
VSDEYVLPSDFCRELANGDYTHPGDPHAWIACSNGNAYVMQCPPGLVFDQQRNQCVLPEEAAAD